MNYILHNEETERLSFRLLQKTDFDSFITLFEEENVAKYLGLDSLLSAKELTGKLFDKCFHRYENDLGGMNALIEKNSGNIVGICGILVQDIDKKKMIEIGYMILPQFWGKRYASEAAIKCRDFAFENNFAEELVSMIHKDNLGSIKVAINNGMTLFNDKMKAPDEEFNLYRIVKKYKKIY